MNGLLDKWLAKLVEAIGSMVHERVRAAVVEGAKSGTAQGLRDLGIDVGEPSDERRHCLPLLPDRPPQDGANSSVQDAGAPPLPLFPPPVAKRGRGRPKKVVRYDANQS